MFNENLKTLRKNKGLTQEELAHRVHVVRQTVSKWEKGLSVPDADVLQRIADVLDVSVGELLGADIKIEADRNEVAEQLGRINEQLAVRNRRWKWFWRIVGIIVLANIFVSIIAMSLFSNVKSSGGSAYTQEEVEMIDGTFTEE